jgi:membrane protein YdbS with pleckstrin-like domain
MFCRFCGFQLPDDSRFCNRCGKPLAGASAAADAGAPPPLPGGAGAAAPAPRPAGPPPLPPESDLWAGGRSARSMADSFAFAGLCAVGVLALLVAVPKFRGFTVYFLAGAVVPLLFVYGAWLWEKVRVQYRLTTARLFKREGVLFRRSSEIELIRVDDVTVEQSLVDRIFNTGTVVVNSTDSSDPVLRIEGIDRPHDVKEQVRNAVVMRRRGVAFVERI